MPDSETETDTEKETNSYKLAQNSMGTIRAEMETDRACPTCYTSRRYDVFTLVETKTNNYKEACQRL